MSSNYQRGAARERQLQDRLEEDGWVVTRSAGSKSPHDLHCSRAGETLLIQCKGSVKSTYANFGPAERDELREAAAKAGATAYLVHWPPDRRGPRWVHQDFWP